MKLIVVEPHRSNYPRPIQFKQGERLVAEAKSSEYEGWMWVTTPDGNQGWAPIDYLRVDSATGAATAAGDYDARELDTCAGEVLTLKYGLREWGWVENQHGMCGWVPLKTTRATGPDS